MNHAELVIDTNVVSYQFRGGLLGLRYTELIGRRPAGVTWLTLAEIHYGCALENWGEHQRAEFDSFLNAYRVIRGTGEIARICGTLRAERRRIGRPIDLADAWIAATALWLDIPLVTHDRDHEAIPGLKIVTLHDGWRVRDPGEAYQFVPGREEIAFEESSLQ